MEECDTVPSKLTWEEKHIVTFRQRPASVLLLPESGLSAGQATGRGSDSYTNPLPALSLSVWLGLDLCTVHHWLLGEESLS